MPEQNWFEQMFPGCSMEIRMTDAGNYLLFASPGVTIEDVIRDLPANHPVNGGKPSRATPADKRLSRNKPQPTQKPATMPVKKTGK